MAHGQDVDMVRRFAAQLRLAFMRAGVRPTFEIKMTQFGRYEIVRVKQLEFDDVPQIAFPAPDVTMLMDLKFQKRVNSLLRSNPCVLIGRAEDRLPNVTGTWRVEICGIRRMTMEDDGVVVIAEADWRDRAHPFGGR